MLGLIEGLRYCRKMTNLLEAIDGQDDLLGPFGKGRFGREVADLLQMVFWRTHDLDDMKSEARRRRHWVQHHQLDGTRIRRCHTDGALACELGWLNAIKWPRT